MPDKKLIYDKLPDGEIKKVLECCLYGDCQDCFYGGTDQRCCRDDLMQNCLEYFNRLQAENERLKETTKTMSTYIKGNGWGLVSFVEFCKNLKAEAYKEFAERLYEELRMYGIKDKFNKSVFLNIADKVKKEMVGDNNG